MCGIAGFSLTALDIKQGVKPQWLAYGLLLGIEERGQDATGWAAVDPETEGVYYHKAPVTASQFVRKGYLDLPTDSQTAILHTRAATQGATKNNLNNHPIVTDKVIGVHNGIIGNDDTLFKTKQWDRRGDVDSEILFKYIEEEGLRAMVQKVEGDAAIAWLRFQTDPKNLNLAALGGRPLVYARTPGGGLVFASTRKAIEHGAEWGETSTATDADLPDGFAMMVREGVIVKEPWKVGELRDAWPTRYGYTSYGSGFMGNLCPDCNEVGHSCICEWQSGALATFPRPEDWETNPGVKFTPAESDDDSLTGSYKSPGVGYRCGDHYVSYTVWEDWRNRTRKLRAELKDLQDKADERELDDLILGELEAGTRREQSEYSQEGYVHYATIDWTDATTSEVWVETSERGDRDFTIQHYMANGMLLDEDQLYGVENYIELHEVLEAFLYVPTFKDITYFMMGV